MIENGKPSNNLDKNQSQFISKPIQNNNVETTSVKNPLNQETVSQTVSIDTPKYLKSLEGKMLVIKTRKSNLKAEYSWWSEKTKNLKEAPDEVKKIYKEAKDNPMNLWNNELVSLRSLICLRALCLVNWLDFSPEIEAKVGNFAPALYMIGFKNKYARDKWGKVKWDKICKVLEENGFDMKLSNEKNYNKVAKYFLDHIFEAEYLWKI